jgi:hypothetical protein
MRRECNRQFFTLIETALLLAFRREWNGDQCASLLNDILRPVDACHSERELFSDTVPALVLERMHHAESKRTGRPTHTARRANKRRQHWTPSTIGAARRMSAALTSRRWKHWCARPTRSADRAAFDASKQRVANDATAWKKEIGRGTNRSAHVNLLTASKLK